MSFTEIQDAAQLDDGEFCRRCGTSVEWDDANQQWVHRTWTWCDEPLVPGHDLDL